MSADTTVLLKHGWFTICEIGGETVICFGGDRVGELPSVMVRSRSTPGVWYDVVRTETGELRCSCKAGSHGVPCHHVKNLTAAVTDGKECAPRVSDNHQ